LYDANGNKLRKTVSNGTSQDYLGGIEYSGGAIEAIYHEEGRATPVGAGWQYEYSLKDHLGNTRVIFIENLVEIDTNGDGINDTTVSVPEIIQEADYYPFGMRHDRSVTATNHYLYNGKELNTDLGLDWYDYGFRWYDAELGRFPSVDPIIENFPDLTPYNYASNNPSTLIDLWGLQGVNPYFYPRDAENSTDYLNAALQKYAIAFNEAKSKTIALNKEYGYGIFADEDGNLEITNRVEGESIEVNVGAYIMDVKERKKKDRLSSRIEADPNDGANVSELYLVGVYHTHPDKGEDQDPISTGDAMMFTTVVKSKWQCYGGFAIGKGFFVIADDVNGGRYAFVLENAELAKISSKFIYEAFVSQNRVSIANAEIDAITVQCAKGENITTGQRCRVYYPIRFEKSGIQLYYDGNNTSTQLRLLKNDFVPVHTLR